MVELKHIGTPRHSGRYPWGSGTDPNQRNKSFLGYVHDLEKQGLSEVEIAKGLGLTTSKLRARRAIVKSEQRAADVATALRLKQKGYSNVAIGEKLKINESSVRSLLDPMIKERGEVLATVANMLSDSVEKKSYIDVGAGVETHLGISRTKLDTAVSMLEEEGYKVHYIKVRQLGTGKDTSIKVLTAPNIPYSEVFNNRYQIKMITDYSEDGGRSILGLEPIKSIKSDRIDVRYAEDGGKNKDGVIELRRGVDDISLGNSKYAQVRIGVDDSHFMKGMAMYSDNIPKGKDVVYNTNKPRGSDKDEVFKPMKDDPDNPFGSIVRQRHYTDADGKSQLSTLNIVNEEGQWSTWSRSLSSQMLSKQRLGLAQKQLKLVYDLKKEEFDEIMSLTNPAVKKRLLETFADEADSAAVHLKAAALPRQSSHIILPISNISEKEVYAPNFRHGENVVLIRHPHGGTFEIPELVVNNKNQEAKRLIGNAKDAIGINSKVANRLSGADFDGDTVLVIPNRSGIIKSTSPLKGLKNFDAKTSYPFYDGMKPMTTKIKELKMGDISNLITDMTIKGARQDEIARAVRHSMVVIDAEKHKLNYKQSYIDNNISSLKKEYQGGERAGASTLVSKASSEIHIPYRKEGKFITDPKTGKTKRIYIDPKTGKKLYEETGETFIKLLPSKKLKVVLRTTVSTRMAEIDDAFKLSSGTDMEDIYAGHANSLKKLANKARKAGLETPPIHYSHSARITYLKEVSSLRAKLTLAFRNKPLERQAQLLANKVVSSKRKATPDMEPPDLKKIKGQALEEARRRVGAKKNKIVITDGEWEAIQAGAVSNNTLIQILLNTELTSLKQRAMPKYLTGMSPARTVRAQSMLALGHTRSEIADVLGVSINTLDKALE